MHDGSYRPAVGVGEGEGGGFQEGAGRGATVKYEATLIRQHVFTSMAPETLWRELVWHIGDAISQRGRR